MGNLKTNWDLAIPDIAERGAEVARAAADRLELTIGCSGEDACRALGLKVIRRPLPLESPGAFNGQQRCVTVAAQLDWEPRVQFTIFHEVMHALLEEEGRVIEFLTNTLANHPDAYERAIERCCDAGAAEFMLPRNRIREELDTHGLSIELLPQVLRDFPASVIPAMIQIANCSPVKCYFVLCSAAGRSDGKLSVEQSSSSPSAIYTIARGLTVPTEHISYDAWELRRMVKRDSFVFFRKGSRIPCQAEAVVIGGRVAALLLPDGRPSPDQQTLF